MENTTKQTGYPSIDKPWLKYYDKVFLDKPLPAMNIYSYLKEMTKNCLDKTAIYCNARSMLFCNDKTHRRIEGIGT